MKSYKKLDLKAQNLEIPSFAIRADKNLKAELGIIFDCLCGTEKKVRKLRHFAKNLRRYFYNNKKGHVNGGILPKKKNV